MSARQHYFGTKFTGETVKCALFKSSLAFSPATHYLYGQVSASECTGTNYTAGGVTVSGKTATYADYKITLDCTDPVFTNITVSDIGWVCFYYTANGEIILMNKLDSPVGADGVDVTYVVPASGLCALETA